MVRSSFKVDTGRWLAAVLFMALAGLMAACHGPATRQQPTAEPDGPRAEAPVTSDSAFAWLVERLSEPGGYFDTDNLISNETSYLHVLGALRERGVSGGAFIGVGPDQGFAYIAQVRPNIAFMIDIRRDNLLQHLFSRPFLPARTTASSISACSSANPFPTTSAPGTTPTSNP